MIVNEHFRARMVEWLLAGVIFSWGVILLLPSKTFDLPTLAGLARVAPEWQWGVAFFIVGTARLLILYVNGLLRRSAHARMVCAMFSAFAWFSISAGLFYTAIVAPGLMTYPLFFAVDSYVVFLAARDARKTDEALRDGTI